MYHVSTLAQGVGVYVWGVGSVVSLVDGIGLGCVFRRSSFTLLRPVLFSLLQVLSHACVPFWRSFSCILLSCRPRNHLVLSPSISAWKNQMALLPSQIHIERFLFHFSLSPL
ncbi:hypothetical protein M407DRAFT_203505 [Tulasnella calospora MUT 4182]|uniref:Uncharacterized protein n=1 Tax=Tulasnella calospora MUT 4182 TaxID=1051891 RepID=A0A0C3QHM0_9AGAM|nr:hypothetical protein M407DRAFT_203505 [Tulasnella calospora MUT 4182]